MFSLMRCAGGDGERRDSLTATTMLALAFKEQEMPPLVSDISPPPPRRPLRTVLGESFPRALVISLIMTSAFFVVSFISLLIIGIDHSDFFFEDILFNVLQSLLFTAPLCLIASLFGLVIVEFHEVTYRRIAKYISIFVIFVAASILFIHSGWRETFLGILEHPMVTKVAGSTISGLIILLVQPYLRWWRRRQMSGRRGGKRRRR